MKLIRFALIATLYTTFSSSHTNAIPGGYSGLTSGIHNLSAGGSLSDSTAELSPSSIGFGLAGGGITGILFGIAGINTHNIGLGVASLGAGVVLCILSGGCCFLAILDNKDPNERERLLNDQA